MQKKKEEKSKSRSCGKVKAKYYDSLFLSLIDLANSLKFDKKKS